MFKVMGLEFTLTPLVSSKGKTTGTNSILMENVCGGLTNGDRLLETTRDPVRKVKVTLDQRNAIQPGDPNFVVPAQFFGTITSSVRFMNKCTCGAGACMRWQQTKQQPDLWQLLYDVSFARHTSTGGRREDNEN